MKCIHDTCIAAVFVCLVSCGGSSSADGSNSTSNAPPFLQAPDDITITEPTTTVTPIATDDDGDDLSIAWTLDSGPSPVVLIQDNNNGGTVRITFPMNGVYQLRVTADDGNRNSRTDTQIISVDVPNNFMLNGNVADGVIGAQTGTSDVPCQLRWTLYSGNPTIMTSTSNRAGNFSFNQLIGSAADYQVYILGK